MNIFYNFVEFYNSKLPFIYTRFSNLFFFFAIRRWMNDWISQQQKEVSECQQQSPKKPRQLLHIQTTLVRTNHLLNAHTTAKGSLRLKCEPSIYLANWVIFIWKIVRCEPSQIQVEALCIFPRLFPLKSLIYRTTFIN